MIEYTLMKMIQSKLLDHQITEGTSRPAQMAAEAR